jgi:hypothetical protein
VVGVLGRLVDVDLDPLDLAGKGTVGRDVVVADGAPVSVPRSVVSSPEKTRGIVPSTRSPSTSAPST